MFKKTKINIDLTNATIISQNSSFEGEVLSEDDIRLDGFFKGEMTSGKKIIIGKNGVFYGELKCENLINKGKIKGNASVSNSTILFAKSKFNGILSTQNFKVEGGASFDGNCNTGSANQSFETIEIIKEESENETKDLSHHIETQTETVGEILNNN